MHCDTRFLSILLNYVPNIKLFPLYFTKMTCFQPFYDTIKAKQSTIGTDVDSTPKEAIHMSEFLLALDDVLYYPILIIVLLAAGLYFTFTTGFVQFRWLRQSIRVIMEKPEKEGSISSFQALMVSTASRVGTGNIIGISTALCLGGFGSVFWMWAIAMIGSATAFIESTLAQVYKRKDANGDSYGGPAYYIETALHNKTLAIAFAIALYCDLCRRLQLACFLQPTVHLLCIWLL